MTDLDLGPGRRAGGTGPDIPRPTAAQRAPRWGLAALIGTCIVTGLILYVGPLTAAVGRRETVRFFHVWAGVLMPVPFVLAYAGRWRGAVRKDFRRLARWTWEDKRWLRTRGREQT